MTSTTSDKPTAPDTKPIPKRARKRLAQWQWLHRMWWTAHYAIGFAGVLAGGLAAVGSKIAIPVVYVGLVAAVCTSLVTFLGPLTKAERYWRAFHEADQACLDYESGHISSKQLNAAIKAARTIVITGFEGAGQSDTQRTQPKDAQEEHRVQEPTAA